MSATQLIPTLFSQNSALFAASVLFTIVLLRTIYNLFLSSLSAIPGPWYAAISDFWLTTHVLRFQQCKTVHQLFETYGPVVRVGPNKVVFRDIQTCRAVYAVHKFDKSAYYKSLLTYVTSLPVCHLTFTDTHRSLAMTTITRTYFLAYMHCL